MLSELLTTERVRVPLGSHTKSALLRELVVMALGAAHAANVEAVLSAVESREAEASTALAGGLAVPHGRTERVPQVTMACGLTRGVRDYRAPDGSDVQVVFLVLTPPQEGGAHVRILARIARLMHQTTTREALLAAGSPEEFISVVRQADAGQRALAS